MSKLVSVHFFDIWTSKKAQNSQFLTLFDFQMCFAPQQRAPFRHLNVQKWSEHVVFLTFWLGNALGARTACTFWTSHLPKSGPGMCFVHFDLETCFAPHRHALSRHLNFQKRSDVGALCTFWLGKCASCDTGVQFFISHLARWLRTRRFSKPTCRPSRSRARKSLENHSESRLSYLFVHLHLLSLSFSSLIFSLLVFSSGLFTPLLFHLSILSEVWLLNFLRLYYDQIWDFQIWQQSAKCDGDINHFEGDGDLLAHLKYSKVAARCRLFRWHEPGRWRNPKNHQFWMVKTSVETL